MYACLIPEKKVQGTEHLISWKFALGIYQPIMNSTFNVCIDLYFVVVVVVICLVLILKLLHLSCSLHVVMYRLLVKVIMGFQKCMLPEKKVQGSKHFNS